jgi:hypothetical protein
VKLTSLSSRSLGRARAQIGKAFGISEEREIAEQSKHRLKSVLHADRELLSERVQMPRPEESAPDDELERRGGTERALAVERKEAAQESKRRLAHLLKRDRRLLSERPGLARDERADSDPPPATDVVTAQPVFMLDPALEQTFAELLSTATPTPPPAAVTVAGLWASSMPAAELARPQPTAAAPAPAPTEAESGREPIRTRSMARLLASQGHRDRALSIYSDLLAQNADDDSLRAEADALRQTH